MLFNLVTLFRAKIAIIYLFPLVLSMSVGLEQVKSGVAAPAGPGLISPAPLPAAVLALAAHLCGSLFASSLNFYADVASDRLHDGRFKDLDLSRQPFVTGEVSGFRTVLLFTLSAAGCIGFSLLVNFRFAGFLVAGMFVLGMVYSHPWLRFKEKPVLDVLTNCTAALLILYAGMSVFSSDCPPLLPSAFGFFMSATLYIPSVASDVPCDRAAGYRTSGVVFGQRRLLLCTIPLTVVAVILGAWTVASGDINWQYRLFCGIATPGIVVGTIGAWHLYRPPSIEIKPPYVLVPISLLLSFYLGVLIYNLAT